MKLTYLPVVMIGVALLAGCANSGASAPAPAPEPVTTSANDASSMHIATWNLEHLAWPIDAGCKPRTASDIAAMKDYAAQLDADIVALQEVASEAAVRQIFPSPTWRVIISERPDSEPYECRENGFTSTQQKVAFAVKSDIEVLAVDQMQALGLTMPGLRYGLGITVNSPRGPMDLLDVHMKSGCFVDDYRQSDSEACEVYARQAPLLDKWVAAHEASGRPYVILGDFNHRLSAPYNRLTRLLLNDARSTAVATRQLIGCHPRYPAPIDHIVVGGVNSRNVTASATVHGFDGEMLSDHCAVSAVLFDDTMPLSSAVRWQTKSKEYPLLTAGIYQRAEASLPQVSRNVDNWVVVMDVDETVLDNSAYQRQTERLGTGYSPDSWNAWVSSEAATLVPGAKDFIETVFAQGGKVALITNRNRSLDAHTWQNLKALGLPVTAENTCLRGRTDADKQAVGKSRIINDKDLRRQQIEQGTISCHEPTEDWSSAHRIVMQVGDNIQDFAGVTQENADINALLPELGESLILLPNPMYGSW